MLRKKLQSFSSPLVLALKALITTKVICFCCLMKILDVILTNSVDSDQTAHSSYRSSLILVQDVCPYIHVSQILLAEICSRRLKQMAIVVDGEKWMLGVINLNSSSGSKHVCFLYNLVYCLNLQLNKVISCGNDL